GPQFVAAGSNVPIWLKRFGRKRGANFLSATKRARWGELSHAETEARCGSTHRPSCRLCGSFSESLPVSRANPARAVLACGERSSPGADRSCKMDCHRSLVGSSHN